jgi:hypothetical protein
MATAKAVTPDEKLSVATAKPEAKAVTPDEKLSVGTADAKINSEPGTTCLFKVSYSKDYKGEKHFLEGNIYEVAVDAAELFESKGIGKKVD